MNQSSNNKIRDRYFASPLRLFFLAACFFAMIGGANGQYVQNNLLSNQPNRNPMANSSAFRQEIARMEINVYRSGHDPLPMAQVPRLQKNDVIKVKLSEDPINGVKPDQSNYNWTFLIAFINPGMKNDGS